MAFEDSTSVAVSAPSNSSAFVTAASTNSALIKTGTRKLQGYVFHNIAAYTVWVKLYDKATAPVVGTDVPKLVIPVAAGAQVWLPKIGDGVTFTNGLGIGATKAAADTDTTVTVANDVRGAVVWG
jgi:hypothetical protein